MLGLYSRMLCFLSPSLRKSKGLEAPGPFTVASHHRKLDNVIAEWRIRTTVYTPTVETKILIPLSMSGHPTMIT